MTALGRSERADVIQRPATDVFRVLSPGSIYVLITDPPYTTLARECGHRTVGGCLPSFAATHLRRPVHPVASITPITSTAPPHEKMGMAASGHAPDS